MNELSNLTKLRDYLKPSGSTRFVERAAGQASLKEYSLSFITNGKIPIYWPVTGQADFNFIYNEATSSWSCVGSMFGINPASNDPKVWLHSVAKGVNSQVQILNSLLQRTMFFWEQYNGDLPHFAHKLALDLAATGTMVQTNYGFYWQNTIHPEIKIFFSSEHTPAGYGIIPKARFGFYDLVKTHIWQLTPSNLSQMSQSLTTFSSDAYNFCEGASACFNGNT